MNRYTSFKKHDEEVVENLKDWVYAILAALLLIIAMNVVCA